MATSSVILDIRANTQRALSDFKTFSAQLDNKFLVSGLKLDVVRSALSQINREFQKSLGEEGLSSAQSLKAAQNQVAALTTIYAGFSKTASTRIVEDFSTAMNQVAVKIGATAKDVQGSLRLAPFLSAGLPESVRKGILEDVTRLQTYARRSGLGGNAAEILTEFATGQVGGNDLQSRDDTLSKILGAQLSRFGVRDAETAASLPIAERTRILQQIIADLDLEKLAKETGGFRAVLEQFSASLFNPELGLLGAMRKFTIIQGEAPTTLFNETTKLFESIFGEEGFIKVLAKELAKAFGVKDSDAPLKFLGRGIRAITNFIKIATDLIDDVINSPLFQGAVSILQSVFRKVGEFFTKLNDFAQNSSDLPKISTNLITNFMEEVGKGISKFIRKLGEDFRNLNTEEQTNTIVKVLGTYAAEIGRVMGTAVSEALKTLFSDKGADIIMGAFEVIRKGLTAFFTEIFGGGAGSVFGTLGAVGIVAAFGKTITMGVLGFAASLIAALPGGQTLMKTVGKSVGNRIASIRKSLFGDNDDDDDDGGGRGRRRGRGGRGPRGGGGVPNLDELISQVRGGGDRYSLDEMFGEIRRKDEIDRFNREFGKAQRDYKAKQTPYLFSPDGPNRSLYGNVREGYLGARKENIRNRAFGRSSTEAFDRYVYALREPFAELDDIGRIERANRILDPRASAYSHPIGPLPHGSSEPWAANDDGGFSPYMESRETNTLRDQRLMERYRRRYGMRGRLGRGVKRFGKGALIAGAVSGGAMLALGAGGAMASEIDLETGMPKPTQAEGVMNVLGGGMEGAMLGATIGSVVPGIGTAAGAVIGGIIGGIVPLMDKGTKEAVDKFAKGIGKTFTDLGTNIAKAATGLVDMFKQGMQNVGNLGQEFFTKTLPGFFMSAISGWLNMPKILLNFGVELGKNMLESVYKFDLGAALKSTWDAIKDFAGNAGKRVGVGNYSGSGYYGPSMALEASMSGGRPMLVNDREFVIPRDGVNILADLVTRKSNPQESTQNNLTVNLTINATGLAGDDIAESIRYPVLRIINDEFNKATASMVTRGSTNV